jgi:hypothetical protein
MEQKSVLPPLRDKKYGGAWSIHDVESTAFLKGIDHSQGNRKEFLNDYRQWFCNNKDFKGLEQFQHIDFSAGTTETFGQFYYQHINKRLRLIKGEYFYHWLMARNYFKSSEVIGDEPLADGDVVVMSCPFSDTGNTPDNFYDILRQCEDLHIPVMLDLAYINVSNISELDLSYKCIHTITTSLSKIFPVESHRIGIRLRRDFYDDSLFAYNQNDYVNLHSVNVGHQLIKKFDNNWLYNKYETKQAETCAKLGVAPSSCVIFGLGQKGNFDEYNRGGKTNRLCFSKLWDKRIT